MNNTALFQGLTIMRPPTLEQAQRQNARSLVLFFIGTCLLCLVCTLVAFFFIIQRTWTTGGWADFWGSNFILSFVMPFLALASLVLHLAKMVQQRTQTRQEATRALPLRQAAAAGNEVLAPLATNQPKSSEYRATAKAVSKWGPLKQPIHETQEWLLALGCVLVGFGVIFLVTLPLAGVTPAAGQIVVMIAVFLIIGGSPSLLWAWRLSGGIKVQANEWGLKWRRLRWWGTTRTSLAWQDARAFYTFVYKQKKSTSLNKLYVYVLDAPASTLAWLLPERDTAQAEAIHTHFCSLILERTGLPLRDLSAAVEDLEKRSPEGAVNWAIRKLTSGETASVISSLDMLPQPHKRTRLPRMIWYVVAIPFLFLALTAGGAWGLQTYQSYQNVNLLMQVRSHKPLFHDALTGPDGDWVVQAPTATDPESFSFMNSSYQLTGGFPMEAMAPGLFRDAAVEVTVRPLHWPQSDDFQGVGLVLHSNAASDDGQIVFWVAPDGYWFVGPASLLFDGYDHERQGGHLNAATSNRLTVIMRGSQYICYVNDTFLGIYQAGSSKSGQVGIYAEPYHDVVAFNDFTIYPL